LCVSSGGIVDHHCSYHDLHDITEIWLKVAINTINTVLFVYAGSIPSVASEN